MAFIDRHIGKIVFLVLILAFVILWFGPFEVAYKLNYSGKVYPSKKWSLKQDNNQYFTENRNFADGFSESMQSFTFDRGDIVEMKFNESLANGSYVDRGSELLEFTSYLLEQEIADLETKISSQLAMFKSENTGSKISVINESERSLDFAKQQLDLEEKNYERGKNLFEDEIIPEAEFQIIENNLALAKANVELAKQKVVSARTGTKTEKLDVVNAQLENFEANLNILNEKKRGYKVRAPFEGEIRFDAFSNSLISLIDTLQQVVIVPIEVAEKSFINENKAKACLHLPGCDENFDMNVHLDKKVNIVDNRQVVLAKVKIPNNRERMDEGLMVNCEIVCDTIPVREYIKRKLF